MKESAFSDFSEMFDLIIENPITGIVICDKDGRFLFANQVFCKLIEYSLDELIQKSVFDITLSSNQESLNAFIIDIQNQKVDTRKGQKEYITKSQKIVYCEVSVSIKRDENNDMKYIIAFVQDITEKKIDQQINEDLKHSKEIVERNEAHHLRILKTANEGIWEVDTDLQTKFVNERMLLMLGYKAREMAAVKMTDVMADVDFNLFKDQIRSIGVQAETREYRFVRKNGTTLWTSATITLLKNKKGTLEGFFGMFTDITEKKKTEEKLRQSEEKLSKIFASNPAIISIHNLQENSKFIDCNDAFVRLSGYSREEIIGHTTDQLNLFANPRDRERMLSEIKMNGRIRNHEYAYRCKNGEIKIGLAAAETIMLDGALCAIITIQDITAQKSSLEKLKMNELMLRQIIDLVPHFIYVKDIEGRFFMVNKALADTHGMTVDEVLGKTDAEISLINGEAQHFRDDDLYVLRSGKQLVVPSETITDHKGNQRILHTTKLPFVFTDTDEKYLLGISIDITEQKKMDQELFLAKEKAEESERLKTSFLNNMSHEVRTPLNAIVGFSQLIAKPNQSADRIQFLTELITESSEQLIEIISDIIEISQIHSNQIIVCDDEIEITDLFVRIGKKFEPRCMKKQIDFIIELDLDCDKTQTISDFYKLNKIFKQLIDNAIKFTDQGYISINCKLRPDDFYEFRITDTGIGIMPDMLEKIFDNFRQAETGNTRNFGGNGVGLSIVKAYVERLGGKIWLNSIANKGTTIYFTIPYKPFTDNQPHIFSHF